MKPSEQIFAGQYGPFNLLLIKNYNIQVTGKKGSEEREGYHLDMVLGQGNILETYTYSMNFVKGFGPEFELIAAASNGHDQLPKVLIEVAFEHLCTDGIAFRRLIMRVYNKAIARGEDQIRKQFHDLMKIPRG